MQASLNLQRELKNRVECGRIRSPHFYPHFHSHIEIYLVLSGEVEVLINNQKKLLGAGEIAVSMGYDTHGYRTPVAAEVIYLIIPSQFCSDYLPLFSQRHMESPYLNDPTLFQTVLDAEEHLLAGGNEITRQGYLYVILGAIFDQMSPRERHEDAKPHVFSANVLIYIHEHFREHLTLTQVAKAFGYNESYFSRYFRQSFGVSFIQYLTMLRLRESILLLQSGKRTVTEAAIESGFGSMRSFYRAFYTEFSCSPKEYLSRL